MQTGTGTAKPPGKRSSVDELHPGPLHWCGALFSGITTLFRAQPHITAKMRMIHRQQIVSELQALGLKSSDAVMMHSSLSGLGPVEGGAPTVVDAIFDAIGQSGTLLVPAFRDSVWGNALDFRNSDCSPCPQRLCPSCQPGFQGAIAEEVRKRSGSLRSCHPTHSWVALGASAEELLAGHHDSPTPCGTGNPFEKLVSLNAAGWPSD